MRRWLVRNQCKLSNAMKEIKRLDEVKIFGGKLSHLIPYDWKETLMLVEVVFKVLTVSWEFGWG